MVSPCICLHLLGQTLSSSLLSHEAKCRIDSAIANLAQIPKIAIEVRLIAGDKRIDLHQLVTRDNAEMSALATWLADHSPADPVLEFLANWSVGSTNQIDQIFLEWDQPDGRPSIPAIFLPVDDKAGSAQGRAQSRAFVAGVIAKLIPDSDMAARWMDLTSAIGTGPSVSHIGVMRGRAAALRFNVRGISRGHLGPLLRELGWGGDVSAACEWFDRLTELADRVVVAFDLADQLVARIGFEVFLDAQPGVDPRWEGLLDMLFDKGLCAAEKRDALMGVARELYPENDGVEWPAQWIAATMAGPPAALPWLEQRLSHVKLVLDPGRAPEAKAYIAAEHHWQRRSDASPPPLVQPNSLPESIQAAADFLVSAQRQDGLWDDFFVPGGRSDEWASAFVGCALVPLGLACANQAIERMEDRLLSRQRLDGGWGYSAVSPPDADTTIWVLKFLRDRGRSGPVVESGAQFIERHLTANGGIATYLPQAIAGMVAAPAHETGAGWCQDHLCVAANAGGLMPDHFAIYLLDHQNGHWPAYWWTHDFYATALALEALSKAQLSEPTWMAAREQALAWAMDNTGGAQTAFDRAWLIQILLHGDAPHCEFAHKLGDQLLAMQCADGGWPQGAALLFPDPARMVRDPNEKVYPDIRRVYSTASALMALTRLGRQTRL